MTFGGLNIQRYARVTANCCQNVASRNGSSYETVYCWDTRLCKNPFCRLAARRLWFPARRYGVTERRVSAIHFAARIQSALAFRRDVALVILCCSELGISH